MRCSWILFLLYKQDILFLKYLENDKKGFLLSEKAFVQTV